MPDRPRPSPAKHPRTDRSLDLDLEEPKTDPALHAALARHDTKLTIRSVIVAAGALVAGVASFFVFIHNTVQAQTDAGMQVQSEKHEALKTRVQTLEQRFDRFEGRTDQQMNAALDALRVPLNARPLPLDAGNK